MFVELELMLPPFDDLVWRAEVGLLVEDLPLPFSGVLGTAGFFDRWVVSFNYSQSYFVVEEPETFRKRLPADPTQQR